MLAGIALLLVLSGWVCSLSKIQWKTLMGLGGLVAVSQVCPIIHLFAGIVGIRVGAWAGLIQYDPGEYRYVYGDLGAFVATVTTGTVVTGPMMLLGLMVQLFDRYASPEAYARKWAANRAWAAKPSGIDDDLL